jgi:ribose transport system substrate-binding protein
MLVSRQAGYKLTTFDAAGSSTQQAAQFRQAIDAKPAAIFVSPIDPPALAALIVEAPPQASRVIGLDKRMLNEGCASIVFSDQRRVGRLAAEAALDALKRKADEEGRTEVTGRVIQIRGVEDSYPTNDLATGFSEALMPSPASSSVHDAPADWTAEKATQITNEAFRLQKNFDVIYAHNDAIAIGAAKATEAAGQRDNIFIVGTDGLSGQKRGLQLVHQGEIDATIVQPALVDLALQIITKLRNDQTFKPLPAYEIQPVVVVPKNVEQSLRVGTYKLPKL